MRILLDTNFLMDVIKFKVDLETVGNLLLEQYKFATLDKVLAELKPLSQKSSKTAGYAKISLQLIKNYNFEVLKSKQKSVDEELLSLSKSPDIIIATNDRMLRKSLKKLGKKTIYLRSKKHLAIG